MGAKQLNPWSPPPSWADATGEGSHANLYFVFCILYFVFCILYFVFCIMHFVFCILYFVSCISRIFPVEPLSRTITSTISRTNFQKKLQNTLFVNFQCLCWWLSIAWVTIVWHGPYGPCMDHIWTIWTNCICWDCRGSLQTATGFNSSSSGGWGWGMGNQDHPQLIRISALPCLVHPSASPP